MHGGRRHGAATSWAALVVLAVTAALAGCNSAVSADRTQPASPRATQGAAATPKAAATIPPASYTAGERDDMAYGPLDAERLDVCRPEGATTARPGVLLIHGGGWTSGDKSEYDDLCRLLAQRGFVAATMNYRLAPQDTWPAQLVDAQLAVRWMRSSAGDLGLDPARLCAYGDSAGAHLALFLGSLATNHPGDEAGVDAGESPKVRCVVDAFGPVDLTLHGADADQQATMQALLGTTLDADPARYRDASPLFAVSAASAPTLIVQGAQDTLVPPSQSQALQRALQGAGVLVQYISYDGDHAFTGLTQDQIEMIVLEAGLFIAGQVQR